MVNNGSLMARILTGEGIGFLIGVVGFFLLPRFVPDASWMLRVGVLLWYTTMGFVIGLEGLFDWKSVIKVALPWWIRAPLVGAWLNLIVLLLAYDMWAVMMVQAVGSVSLFASPWWTVVEGAVIGLIIGFFATRVGGEKRIGVGAGPAEGLRS